MNILHRHKLKCFLLTFVLNFIVWSKNACSGQWTKNVCWFCLQAKTKHYKGVFVDVKGYANKQNCLEQDHMNFRRLVLLPTHLVFISLFYNFYITKEPIKIQRSRIVYKKKWTLRKLIERIYLIQEKRKHARFTLRRIYFQFLFPVFWFIQSCKVTENIASPSK